MNFFNIFFTYIIVPSAPGGLKLVLTSQEPPVLSISWQRPRNTYGSLEGYRLKYGRKDEDKMESRGFIGEVYHFTTGFLGQSSYIFLCFIYIILIKRCLNSRYPRLLYTLELMCM